MEDAKWFLELPRVSGTLKWRGHAIDVSWSLTVSQRGEVSLSFDPVVLSHETAWLIETIGGKGRFATWGEIRGTTDDQRVVESSHVVFSGRQLGGSTVQLLANATRLRLTERVTHEIARSHAVSYLTIGMLGFSQQAALSEVGRVTVSAPAKLDDYGLLSGIVAIEAPDSDRAFGDWLTACDELAETILGLVSFAEGRVIRWSVRQIYAGGQLVLSDFRGPQNSSLPWDSTFHFLDLQPVLDLALGAYTKEMRDRTGFDVALEWFLTHPQHLEVQLLGAVGALEHLVMAFGRQNGVLPIVPPIVAEPLLREVETIFRTAADQAGEHKKSLARLGQKVATLNEASFRDRLTNMLTIYRIPLAGIENHVGAAIAARNRVVHSGLYSEPKGYRELYRHVAVVRELLKRVFLTLLGFRGQYHSMLNGSEWVTFPPVDVVLDLEDEE